MTNHKWQIVSYKGNQINTSYYFFLHLAFTLKRENNANALEYCKRHGINLGVLFWIGIASFHLLEVWRKTVPQNAIWISKFVLNKLILNMGVLSLRGLPEYLVENITESYGNILPVSFCVNKHNFVEFVCLLVAGPLNMGNHWTIFLFE